MSISRLTLFLSLYATVAVLSFPVADLAFRALGDRPSRDLAGMYVAWSDGSYRLSKGVRTSAEFYSGPMEVITDSLGLRTGADSSRWHDRGDTTDILLLGDSQTFGNNLNWPETIGGQLDSLAQSVGWRVASAGTGAHSFQNQIEVAQSLIREDSLVPRQIVVLFTPVMISRPGFKNRARVGDDGRLYQGAATPVRRLTMWLKMNTTVYARARGAFRYVRELVADDTNRDAARDPGVVGFYDVRSRTIPKRDSLAAQILDLNRLAAEVGASVSVAYLPLAIEGSFGIVDDLAKSKGLTVSANAPELLLREAARQSGIDMIDLRPALDTAVARGQPLTVVADPHYSSQVSSLIARELWTGLRSLLEEHVDGNAR